MVIHIECMVKDHSDSKRGNPAVFVQLEKGRKERKKGRDNFIFNNAINTFTVIW